MHLCTVTVPSRMLCLCKKNTEGKEKYFDIWFFTLSVIISVCHYIWVLFPRANEACKLWSCLTGKLQMNNQRVKCVMTAFRFTEACSINPTKKITIRKIHRAQAALCSHSFLQAAFELVGLIRMWIFDEHSPGKVRILPARGEKNSPA